MVEKHDCGAYLAFCTNCKTIFCPKCHSRNRGTCPECGKIVTSGNVKEVTHKIARVDYS